MSELMEKILRRKEESRKKLAALSFEEKIALVEKMRDRSLLIAQSPLRKAQKSRADRTENAEEDELKIVN
jgi:hypothetical protein